MNHRGQRLREHFFSSQNLWPGFSLDSRVHTYRVFLLLRDGLHVEGFEVNVGLDEVLLNLLLDRVSLGSNNVELAFGVIHVHRKVHLCVSYINFKYREANKGLYVVA